MTDSPTEKPDKGEPESKTVPKPRFDEVNAKYKESKTQAEAALTEMNQMKAELDRLKATETDVEKMVQERVNATIGDRLGSLQQRADVGDIAMAHGLSQEQARAVLEVRAKYPGLDTDRALLLAKTIEKPELFPQSRMPPRVLPPSPGDSPNRTPTYGSEKYDRSLKEAQQIPDAVERMARVREITGTEFQRRILERKAMGPVDIATQTQPQ